MLQGQRTELRVYLTWLEVMHQVMQRIQIICRLSSTFFVAPRLWVVCLTYSINAIFNNWLVKAGITGKFALKTYRLLNCKNSIGMNHEYQKVTAVSAWWSLGQRFQWYRGGQEMGLPSKSAKWTKTLGCLQSERDQPNLCSPIFYLNHDKLSNAIHWWL